MYKKRFQHVAVVAFATVLTLGLIGAASFAGHHGHDGDKRAKQKDIVDTAASLEQFSTLVTAVKQAGLVETLKGEGPFTVFAPTNAAFAKLPDGTVEALLQPENKDQLVEILTYHVVAGKVKAKDVVELESAETVQGQSIDITVSDGGVMLNDSTKVVKTDVYASNGVIHVIDSVLIPSED